MDSSVFAVGWQLLRYCVKKIEESISECRHANVLAGYFLVQLQIFIYIFDANAIEVYDGLSQQFQ